MDIKNRHTLGKLIRDMNAKDYVVPSPNYAGVLFEKFDLDPNDSLYPIDICPKCGKHGWVRNKSEERTIVVHRSKLDRFKGMICTIIDSKKCYYENKGN